MLTTEAGTTLQASLAAAEEIGSDRLVNLNQMLLAYLDALERRSRKAKLSAGPGTRSRVATCSASCSGAAAIWTPRDAGSS
jgi:hypothetical protein